MLVSLAAATLVTPAQVEAAAVERLRATDVNGDGVPDLVAASSGRLTAWGDRARGAADLGGSVYLLPGGPIGSRLAPALLNQDAVPTIGGTAKKDDTFGQSVATGDFDGDGKADVAVGNPHEELGGIPDTGAVTVQYGQSAAPYVGAGRGGLTWIGQTTAGVPGENAIGDLFGAALATGYLNGDGYADLAVGAPGEAIGGAFEAGRVTVLYGGPTGLTAAQARTFDGTVAGAAEPFDHFGASLAVANLRGDAHDDLAVLASGEYRPDTAGAWGAAVVLAGSVTGVDAAAPSIVDVGATGTTGHLRIVVAGRFHGSAYADLALFADQQRGAAPRSGAVVIAPGGSAGVGRRPLTVLGSDFPYTDAYWGGALAAGDVNRDGRDELAVGALRGANGKGSVTLYTGDPSGLTARPTVTVTEDTPAVGGTAKPGEGFGYALAFLDRTGDGVPELLVGAPWEDRSSAPVARATTTGSLLYELGVAVPPSGPPAVTSSHTTAASAPSSFGPGGPGLAGGATVLTENGVEPSPWLDRLPPLR
ncbi:FG-GAP-like repeat-containing protein [Actinoplanes sp. NPDC023936]|uniref:FG-GAP-like repeat-containing protein n=1 Tax=Actinoplanes sp. NPDC023936 TaxID=3154910 RepID=UPI00340AEA53